MPRMAEIAHDDAVDHVLVAPNSGAGARVNLAAIGEKAPEKLENSAHGRPLEKSRKKRRCK
jgi:hypothetical protein